MGMLKKDLTLYERDEKGILIPQEATLLLVKDDKENYPDLKGQKIKLIPMTRGELRKVFGVTGEVTETQPETDKDTDAELIVKYCKAPVYTIEELAYAKPVIVRSIVRTIFSESGVKFDDDAGTKSIDDNDEFGKNS